MASHGVSSFYAERRDKGWEMDPSIVGRQASDLTGTGGVDVCFVLWSRQLPFELAVRRKATDVSRPSLDPHSNEASHLYTNPSTPPFSTCPPRSRDERLAMGAARCVMSTLPPRPFQGVFTPADTLPPRRTEPG